MRIGRGITRTWMWGTALILTSLLSGGCGPGQDARRHVVAFESEPWRYGRQEGQKFTTEHYEIYTTLRQDALTQALPELMELAFEHYQKIVPASRAPQERMKVYLFAARSDWVDFTRRFTGPRAKQFLLVFNGGYSHAGVSVIQYVAHQTTLPIMAHEGFHQYLHHYVNAAVPAWLNEGLATYCEGQRWGATDFKGFDPWHNPIRRNILAEALQNNKLFSVSELLETNAGRVLRLSTRAVGTYYAQLWALMLFLREGEKGKYAPKFDEMLNQLGAADLEQYARAAFIWSDKNAFSFGPCLFRCFITEDVETFEKEYLAFMRQKVLGGTKR